MKYVWENVKQMPRYRFFNNRRNWYCKGQIQAGRDQFWRRAWIAAIKFGKLGIDEISRTFLDVFRAWWIDRTRIYEIFVQVSRIIVALRHVSDLGALGTIRRS